MVGDRVWVRLGTSIVTLNDLTRIYLDGATVMAQLQTRYEPIEVASYDTEAEAVAAIDAIATTLEAAL